MTITTWLAILIIAIAVLGIVCTILSIMGLVDKQEKEKKGDAGASSMFVRDQNKVRLSRLPHNRMIRCNYKDSEGLRIEGSLSEVSTECVLIMREVYERNVEIYGREMALGILTNMLVKAVSKDIEEVSEVSEEEKLAYTE